MYNILSNIVTLLMFVINYTPETSDAMTEICIDLFRIWEGKCFIKKIKIVDKEIHCIGVLQLGTLRHQTDVMHHFM